MLQNAAAKEYAATISVIFFEKRSSFSNIIYTFAMLAAELTCVMHESGEASRAFSNVKSLRHSAVAQILSQGRQRTRHTYNRLKRNAPATPNCKEIETGLKQRRRLWEY